jgi:glutamyl-tRNA synthetase
LDEGKAYYCYCTREELEAQKQSFIAQGLPPKYSGHCRTISSPPPGRAPQVIRFLTPEVEVAFRDLVRGEVKFDAALLGDMVIARSISEPLYNLAVVIDDHEMKISHVIRGEDHLPNTPKQILLLRALHFREPVYAHLPLLLGPDRRKLSKRYLESSFLEYRDRGYLPEAFVNFLALLGWHPKEDREVLTREELIKTFDIRRVQKGGATFAAEKLEWLNREHLRRLPEGELVARLTAYLASLQPDSPLYASLRKGKAREAFLLKILRVERERMKTLADFIELAGFFFVLPEYEPELLRWQNDPPEKGERALTRSRELLASLKGEELSKETVAPALQDLMREEGTGSVLWPLRVALSGKRASPDPFDILEVLGKKESMRRIDIAREKLSLLGKG